MRKFDTVIRRYLFRFVFLVISVVALARPLFPADLVLSWKDNATNETGFAIERTTGNGTAGASWSVVASVPADVQTWTDTGLPPGQTFAYRVRAFNASGFSGYAGPVSASIPPVPNAPGVLSVTQVTVTVTVNAPAPPGPITPAP